TVIALEDDGAGGRLFIAKFAPARRTGDLDILVNDLPVVDHFEEPRILRLFAGAIEARRAEGNVKTLPLPGCLAGVHAGRVAFITLAILPALVDRAAIVLVDGRLAETIQDLHLVPAHDIDPAVRVLGHTKLDVNLRVAVLGFAGHIHA